MIFNTGFPVVPHTAVHDGSLILTEHGRLVWKGTPNSVVFFERDGLFGGPKWLKAPEFENGLLLPESAYLAVEATSLQWNGAQHGENAGAIIRDHTNSYFVISRSNGYGSETTLFDIHKREINENWPKHGTAVAYTRSAIWLSEQSFEDKEEPLVRIKALLDDL